MTTMSTMPDTRKNRTIQNPNQSSMPGKHPIGQTPLDPTDNAQGMMNDTTGMTGVSKDTNDPNTPPPSREPVSQTMSDFKHQATRDMPSQKDEFMSDAADEVPQATPGSTPTGNKTLDEETPPHVAGEQGMNATNPDPASDDDTLANAQNVGLRLDEDEEHPQELDIGSDIDKAEEFHRTH